MDYRTDGAGYQPEDENPKVYDPAYRGVVQEPGYDSTH